MTERTDIRHLISVTGSGGKVDVQGTELTPDQALDLADWIVSEAVGQGTTLHGMGPTPGGWTVNAQPSEGLADRMKAFLIEWLGPAVNYTETPIDLPFDPGDYETGLKPRGEVHRYVLTVVRAGGKTPHEKRLEAERERDAAVAALRRIAQPGTVQLLDYGTQGLMDIARRALADHDRAAT